MTTAAEVEGFLPFDGGNRFSEGTRPPPPCQPFSRQWNCSGIESSAICRCQQCLWPLLPAAPLLRTGRKTMQVETSVTPVPLLALSQRSLYRSWPVLLLHRWAATVQRPMGMSAWQGAMLLCRSRRVDLRRAEGGQTGRWTIVASPSTFSPLGRHRLPLVFLRRVGGERDETILPRHFLRTDSLPDLDGFWGR